MPPRGIRSKQELYKDLIEAGIISPKWGMYRILSIALLNAINESEKMQTTLANYGKGFKRWASVNPKIRRTTVGLTSFVKGLLFPHEIKPIMLSEDNTKPKLKKLINIELKKLNLPALRPRQFAKYTKYQLGWVLYDLRKKKPETPKPKPKESEPPIFLPIREMDDYHMFNKVVAEARKTWNRHQRLREFIGKNQNTVMLYDDHDIHNIEDLIGAVRDILRRQTTAYKINIQFAYVGITGEQGAEAKDATALGGRMAFHQGKAYTVASRENEQRIYRDWINKNFIENFQNNRVQFNFGRSEGSGNMEAIIGIWGVRIEIYRLNMPLIGAVEGLPKFIINNHSVITHHHIKNNLCVFASIASHFNVKNGTHKRDTRYQNRAKALAEQFHTAEELRNYQGCKIDDHETRARLQKTFNIKINVYTYIEEKEEHRYSDPKDSIALRYTYDLDENEEYDESKVCSLLLFRDHCMYVQNVCSLIRNYKCLNVGCDKIFDSQKRLTDHIRTRCKCGKVKELMPKQSYPHTTADNIIYKLTEDINDFQKPYLVTFDYEAFPNQNLETVIPQAETKGESKADLQFHNHQEPCSLSYFCNFPGFGSEPIHYNVENFGWKASEMNAKFVDDLVKLSKRIGDYLILNKYLKHFRVLLQKAQEYIEYLKFSPNSGPVHCEMEYKPFANFIKWCYQIPVIGYNCGGYDIPLNRNYDLLRLIKETECPYENFYEAYCSISRCDVVLTNIFNRQCEPFFIKAGNRYKSISVPAFKIIDVMNYTPAGYSMDAYLKAYGCEITKLPFPYDFLSRETLNTKTNQITKANFYNNLKQTEINQNEYNKFLEECRTHNLTTLREYLRHYNNTDVKPLLEACVKNNEFYKAYHLDMWNDAITCPGISKKMLIASQYQGKLFNDFVDAYNAESIPETPHRLNMSNDYITSKISAYRSQDAKARRDMDYNLTIRDVREIHARHHGICLYCHIPLINKFTLDRIDNDKSHSPDNLVLACSKCNIERKRCPIGIFKRRKLRSLFIRQHANKLIWQIDEENEEIFHKLKRDNVGGPSIVFNRKVVAINNEDGEEPTRINKLEWDMEKKGWIVHQFDQCSTGVGYDANALYPWAVAQPMPTGQMTYIANPPSVEEFTRMTLQDEWFGHAEIDLHVPEELYTKFAEFPPIFKNTMVGEKPQRKLVSSMFANNMNFIKPLIKFYLEEGLVITAVHSMGVCSSYPIFREFSDAMADSRRAGDVNPDLAIQAETMKLSLNSCIGGTIMNKLKQTKVSYLSDERELGRRIAKNSMKCAEPIRCIESQESKTIFEIEQYKETHKGDLPFQIGSYVYGYAKLRMLQFYYNFMCRYCDSTKFQMCYMDTDSTYMQISNGMCLDDIVKPEMREEFNANRSLWLPRTDTAENRAYDKRTPGLFKVEATFQQGIFLSSKSYICKTWIPSPSGGYKSKCSAKGCNNSQNEALLTYRGYENVFNTNKTLRISNRGFRMVNSHMMMYSQAKDGVTSKYDKRQILEDGRTTAPFLHI